MLRELNELFPRLARSYRYNPETLEVYNWKPSGLLKLNKRKDGRYQIQNVAAKRVLVSERQIKKALDAFNQEK